MTVREGRWVHPGSSSPANGWRCSWAVAPQVCPSRHRTAYPPAAATAAATPLLMALLQLPVPDLGT